MRAELPKRFDPRPVESRLYQAWLERDLFRAATDGERLPFSMVIPPPNVTGSLHLGHALNSTLQDLLARHKRLLGFAVLWLPGTDHAGISTQVVVERELAKQGKTRHDLGREAFIDQVWEWKAKSGTRIVEQLQALGSSCDWSRERFTMDAGLSRAVREVFVRLYHQGLIHRAEYLVNWCPRCTTVLSDLEAPFKPVAGKLYRIRYPAADGRGAIEVETTRPETLLGDTAVAVHPEDERWASLVGRRVRLPLLDREIPVVTDAFVDREFGTGAVKLTPAHDPSDFEAGRRLGLPAINLLHPDGRLNDNAGPYAGLDIAEARRRVVADLERDGLLIGVREHPHEVPHCDRCDTLVQPLLSEQWFVRMEPLAKPAIDAVRDGRIRFHPQTWENTYFHWLENIRDWAISRQLWWGHRIPAWKCGACGEWSVTVEDPTHCTHCGSDELRQEEDVLDTWFSSALWPFSTLGWPDETPDLKYFYPTSYMETGYDILFFWVARMIMSGLEYTGVAPFHTVYLHGLIRDEHGRKMSKTYGNVIDPLVVMDELGTDALRFTLLVGATPGNDMNLSVKKVESNRNFANKVWNAGRFVINAINTLQPGAEPGDYTLADSWIWARLQNLIRDVERQFQNFQYGQAGQQIYDFLWSDFADWYVEVAKGQLQDDATKHQTTITLARVFDMTLRLLHPFTPFVTEEIWGHLRSALRDSPLHDLHKSQPEALIVARWPTPRQAEGWEAEKIADFELIQEIVRSIRNLRAEKNVAPSRKIAASISAGAKANLLNEQSKVIASLAGLDHKLFTINSSLKDKPADSAALVVGSVEIYLPLAGMVDLASEKTRLEKELKEAGSHIQRLENLLNGDFAQKAPPALVQKERDKLNAYKETAEKIKAQLK